MTFDDAIAFWFRRIDFERKLPVPGDLKLDHIFELLERLGRPQERFRIIHVAGSKGKGSTSAMLAAILRAQGCRVGLFTSPHLVRVEERIQVDGEPIPAADLAARMAEIEAAGRLPLAGEPGPLNDSLTFFEIATALGFAHFAARKVDWAVVEVGLGGRFDSTNVCRPDVSVITSISFDHTQMLGDTLAKIAFEKAGIVKPGRPTVSGVIASEARRVIEERCDVVGSPLKQFGRDFSFVHDPAHIDGGDRPGRVAITTWRRAWPSLELNLVGAHQAANAAVAVATIDLLRDAGVTIDDAAVEFGLKNVAWPARLEVIGRRPLTVLDCAHNVASAEAVRDALLTSFPIDGRRILIFAGSRDKDIAGMFAVLAPLFAHIVLTRFESPRALPVDRLAELLPTSSSAQVHLAESAAEALRLARSLASADDLICATGSVFLAGEIRSASLKQNHE